MPVEVTLVRALRGPLRVYPIDSVRPFGVDAFVTDRFGGVSEAPYNELNLASHVGDVIDRVDENRRRVAEAIGVTRDRFITVRQVHGNDVADASNALLDGEADAIICSAPDLAIAILVADCVPVLLVDSGSPRMAVVHAGWRGLHGGVLDRAVARFATPHALHAFIGPAISAERYQVGPEVAEHFAGVPGALIADVGDRSRLDLRRVAAHHLSTLGVSDERIVVSRQTTDGGALFFSDRAARPTGRFALVARRAS